MYSYSRETKKIKVIRKSHDRGQPKLFFCIEDIFRYLGEVKLLTEKQRLSKRWEVKKKLLQQHLNAMKSGEVNTIVASDFMLLDFTDYFIGSEIMAYGMIHKAVPPGKRYDDTFIRFIDIIDRFNMFFDGNYFCEPTLEEKEMFEDLFSVTEMNTDQLFKNESLEPVSS